MTGSCIQRISIFVLLVAWASEACGGVVAGQDEPGPEDATDAKTSSRSRVDAGPASIQPSWTTSGTVGGDAFASSSAVAVVAEGTGGGSLSLDAGLSLSLPYGYATILLTDSPSVTCGALSSNEGNVILASTRTLTLSFTVLLGELKLGSFAVIDPSMFEAELAADESAEAGDGVRDVGIGFASVGETGADCSSPVLDYATGGTMALTAIDATSIRGTYDVIFSDGQLSGTFFLPLCAVPADAGAADAGPTCLSRP